MRKYLAQKAGMWIWKYIYILPVYIQIFHTTIFGVGLLKHHLVNDKLCISCSDPRRKTNTNNIKQWVSSRWTRSHDNTVFSSSRLYKATGKGLTTQSHTSPLPLAPMGSHWLPLAPMGSHWLPLARSLQACDMHLERASFVFHVYKKHSVSRRVPSH